MATQAQVAANRVNGLRGGVKTEAGKEISRMNARKHGIFASALTEYDDEELHGIEEQLVAQLAPVGIIEEMLVEKIAVTYLRMQRCARAEAQHHREMWASPGSIIVRGKREKKIAATGLYDLRLTGQFLRLLREIKELQRERFSQRVDPQISQIPQISLNEAYEEKQKRPDDGTENRELDSRFRGNDEAERCAAETTAEPRAAEMKNEPNPEISECRVPNAECCEQRENEPKYLEEPVLVEVKNEPNPEISECRMPSAEWHEKRKNEPNPRPLQNADCRIPIGDQEVKNEPNSREAEPCLR